MCVGVFILLYNFIDIYVSSYIYLSVIPVNKWLSQFALYVTVYNIYISLLFGIVILKIYYINF